MGVDAQLKRWFPLVLAAMLALTAYLQASGASKLVGASIADAPATQPTTPTVSGLDRKEKSAAPILARNLFDSRTGPLDGSNQPVASNEPTDDGDEDDPTDSTPSLEDLSDKAPSCTFGRVVLISASDDPEWSFAAIDDGSGKPQLRRAGDQISGHTVRAMAWNRVWFDNQGNQCQLKLGDKPQQAAARPTPTPARRPARSGRGQISPEMAAKIHKVSDTEFNIERSLVDELLENQADLMRSARIVPDKQGDKVMGVRLFGIRSNSLLNTLGLQNGDRLETINGFEMSDPQKALEAYGRLRTADGLKVKINRNGQPVTIDFNIK